MLKTILKNSLLVLGLSAIFSTSLHAQSQWTKTSDAAISGHNDKSISGTVEACKKACEEETSFVCQSFDYHKSKNQCDLSKSQASDAGGLRRDYPADPYDHYSRVVREAGSSANQGSLWQFRKAANQAISGFNHRSFKNKTVEECSNLCVKETSFTCRSFDYTKATNQCDLSMLTAAGAGGAIKSSRFDNYQRNSTPSTPKWTLALLDLSVLETDEAGEDEVYFQIYIDQNEADANPLIGKFFIPDYTSKTRTMNEDSGSKLGNWSIRMSFEFEKTIEVRFYDHDGGSGNDHLGTLRYSSASDTGTYYKNKLYAGDGRYEIDVALGGGDGRNPIYDEYRDVKRMSPFKSDVGPYMCNIDPWTERAAPEADTGSACSIPKLIESEDDFVDIVNSISGEAYVGYDIDDLVADKNYKKFHKQCQTHDLCYSAPWREAGLEKTGQEICDSAFLNDMLLECNRVHDDGSPNWAECRVTANVFYTAVDLFGESSFTGGQNWAEDQCRIPSTENPDFITYKVEMDCDVEGIENETTNNTIKASFYKGSTLLGDSLLEGIIGCSEANPTLPVVLKTKASKLVIETDGDDGFMIDKLRVTRDGYEVLSSGLDNDKGWCLSTDAKDNSGSWKDAAGMEGCQSSVEWEFDPH